jgi:hypothetical protein
MINRPSKNIVSITGRFLIGAMLLLVGVTSMVSSVYAVDYPKLSNRSLSVGDVTPGAVTDYTISYAYPAPTTIGSIRLLLCTDGNIDDPCVNPSADMSAATLFSQTGITGFSINSQTANEILLTRTPGAAGTGQSTYVFNGVTNPSGLQAKFFIRIQTYASGNGTGTLNHASSVVSATTEPIVITTEVPPILFFCAAITIDLWCQNTVGNQIDYGTLSPTTGNFATSQFGVATNATGGYVVTVNGNTMTSGFKSISALNAPDIFSTGTAQFGLNLRANTNPAVGQDVTGLGIGTVTANYNVPDTYQFNDGDTVASSVTGSLFDIFTVSYIVNVPPDQSAGVYSTTVAYICTAAF